MSGVGGGKVFVGAIGLAALAGGLAYGVHMVLPVTLSDDFCTLMSEATLARADNFEAQEAAWAVYRSGGSTEAEVLDALHDYGRLLIESGVIVDTYYSEVVHFSVEAESAVAFATYADAFRQVMEQWGTMALDAQSVIDFNLAFTGDQGGADILAKLESLDAPESRINHFVMRACGMNLSVAIDGEESATTPDATLLGEAIQTYYNAWVEGDPVPVVIVADGAYLLGDEDVGAVSEGVALTDQYANGPTDWCVEVTWAEYPGRPWSYSEPWGLVQAPCT